MKETPLKAAHERLGARMMDFAGWAMPVQYGPILDEVRRVRSSAGLFDLSHMGRLVVSGPDAVRFLDSVVTAYCAKVGIGSSRYSLLCREDGRPIDDLLIYRDEGSVLLVVNAANTDEDLAWLRAHARGFDVTIEDHTNDVAMIAVQGPESQAILEPHVEGLDLSSVRYYKFGFATFMGIEDIRLSRTGYTGEDGFEIYLPAQEAERVHQSLLESGAEHGLGPAGLGARDTLRLEAGMPLFGHELDDEHGPIEAGLAFALSFADEKGDWIGREALLRAKDSPRCVLTGLTSPGPRVPRQGYPLFRDGREVGHVSSGSVSPTLNTNVAMAYVPVGMDEKGATFEMDVRGKKQPCTVHGLPFFSRTRK